MGFWNPRAICPNCGAKIHTQSSGWRTGQQCPNCGTALSGSVGWDKKAKRAGEKTLTASAVDALSTKLEQRANEREPMRVLNRIRVDGDLSDSEYVTLSHGAWGNSAVAKLVVKLERHAKNSHSDNQAAKDKFRGEKERVLKMAGEPPEFDWFPEPDDRCDVVLTAIEPGKEEKVRGLAKHYVDDDELPRVIAEGITAANAGTLYSKLEVRGAKVELRESSEKEATASQPDADHGNDVLAQIQKLGELHDAGVLTDAEFESKKAELLARI